MKDDTLCIRLTSKQRQRIRNYAERLEVSQGEFVRRLIDKLPDAEREIGISDLVAVLELLKEIR